MLLYMIRHGESTANVHRLHAGWAQISLTEKGITDAKSAGETLKGINFDKVYSSDLLRAMQTAEFALPGEKAELCDLLREINVGELVGKSIDECIKIYGQRYLTDKKARDFRFYGGENDEMQVTRAKKFLDMVSKGNFEKAAVFCHEGTIRCVLKLANDTEWENRNLKNGGVYIFENVGNEWNFKTEL